MSWELVLQFDTESEEFVRGVEAGRIMELIKHGDEVEKIVHASNTEMMLRIAEANDQTLLYKEIDDDWIQVTFLKKNRGP